METGRRLVAGSRNRNEFVVINADDFGKVSVLKISDFDERSVITGLCSICFRLFVLEFAYSVRTCICVAFL